MEEIISCPKCHTPITDDQAAWLEKMQRRRHMFDRIRFLCRNKGGCGKDWTMSLKGAQL